jgi:very-short-patch-repair endonuclease
MSTPSAATAAKPGAPAGLASGRAPTSTSPSTPPSAPAPSTGSWSPRSWRAAASQVMGLARTQHGVVARAQLAGLGISSDAIDRRLADGWLVPLHRGVYRVGPVETARTREVAAVLACGAGAVVSHGSAVALWKLLPRERAESGVVDVAAQKGYRRHEGIRFHRLKGLRPDETTSVEGVPVTTAERTLVDVTGLLRTRALEQALAEALAIGVASPARVLRILDRHPGARGAARLRALLEGDAPLARTRSAAEEKLLRLIRRAGLPAPQTNVRVHGYEVDFFWPAHRLVVEVDGYASHGAKSRFRRDRRRDTELAAAGLTCVRFTWDQLRDEPEWVLARLIRLLDGRAGRK